MRVVIPYVRVIPTCQGSRYEWGESAVEVKSRDPLDLDLALQQAQPGAILVDALIDWVRRCSAQTERLYGVQP